MLPLTLYSLHLAGAAGRRQRAELCLVEEHIQRCITETVSMKWCVWFFGVVIKSWHLGQQSQRIQRIGHFLMDHRIQNVQKTVCIQHVSARQRRPLHTPGVTSTEIYTVSHYPRCRTTTKLSIASLSLKGVAINSADDIGIAYFRH